MKATRLWQLLPLLALACATSRAPAFSPAKLQEIDTAIAQAIADKRIPGGVFHLERNGSVYQRAYGMRAVTPAPEPISLNTIYDAASLTKVLATAPAIFLLLERGSLALDDAVSRHLPEFRGGWRDEVTIRHLLTHTSGLRPSLSLREPWSGYEKATELATAEAPGNRPGIIFRYSDINFILLGEIVRRVSGRPLEVFVAKEIYGPLTMRDTGFRPSESLLSRIAPTEQTAEGMLRGVVHDPTARRMGGVAGHAGLFTTASDLARYLRMILAGGSLGGVRVFRPETVALMTAVQSPPNVAIRRAGGWDIDSHYARPRGSLFPIGSFGHTGWTGGFVWIDPFSRTFFLFLSNRVHPDGSGSVVALQRTLGTLAAEAVRDSDFTNVAGALPPRPGGRVIYSTGGGSASNGIDVLVTKRYEPLAGLRVGLITGHTGIDKIGNPTIDLLRSAPGVELVALFSPEHGILGVADEKVGDSVDSATGLPIYSLYGERRKPAPEQLAGLDALVYDIQDIGTRFYTYISTLGLAMESASEAGIKFFVLDRVNPVGGVAVEGPLLEGDTSFTAWHPIVVRHGMTTGELAMMFKEELRLPLDLTVIRLEGWKRSQWQDESGLPWINTSPNMRSLTAAAFYPGVGLLERTRMSVGRGAPTPFELFGAPYINEEVLARELTATGIAGVTFSPVRFTPDASKFKGELCKGVRLTLTDRSLFNAVETGIVIVQTLHRLYPGEFDIDKVDELLRHPPTIAAIRAGASHGEIRRIWSAGQEDFARRRRAFLLYE